MVGYRTKSMHLPGDSPYSLFRTLCLAGKTAREKDRIKTLKKALLEPKKPSEYMKFHIQSYRIMRGEWRAPSWNKKA